jgi:hypothetical protein
MNAGEDDSDDGLELAGEVTAALPQFNPIGMNDMNMDMNNF